MWLHLQISTKKPTEDMGALIKQYPRYFFAFMVLLISNIMFFVWWEGYLAKKQQVNTHILK